MDENYGPDILTVTDEEGTEHSFELLDELEHDGQRYFAVTPTDEDPAALLDEDLEVLIMRVSKEDDDDYLDIVDDDEELAVLTELFTPRLEALFEGEEEQ